MTNQAIRPATRRRSPRDIRRTDVRMRDRRPWYCREKKRTRCEGPHRVRQQERVSAFDQPDFAGARSLAGLFRRELHPLSFTQELEHCPPHRAAMEEVLNPPLVANESEPLVDEKPRDRPGWHNPRPPPARFFENIPKVADAELESGVSVEISPD